jgi:hypothetical protein
MQSDASPAGGLRNRNVAAFSPINPDFAVEIYYEKKMLQRQAVA